MFDLSRSEVAAVLGVTGARISQLVAEGRLAGCYAGSGRQRRFNAAACAEAMGARLDAGQQTGNGMAALAARSELLADRPAPTDAGSSAAAAGLRLVLARAEAAELAARQKRREEAEATGRYILADEAARAFRATVADVLTGAERVLIAEARTLAREVGADQAAVVARARAAWRRARVAEAGRLSKAAEAAVPTAGEAAEIARA
jgi:hypothetical protein